MSNTVPPGQVQRDPPAPECIPNIGALKRQNITPDLAIYVEESESISDDCKADADRLQYVLQMLCDRVFQNMPMPTRPMVKLSLTEKPIRAWYDKHYHTIFVNVA